jgi:hypothetical protein
MKTLFAVAALCLSSVAVAAPNSGAKLVGTASGARAAILKAYPGLKANELTTVSRENAVLAHGAKATDVFTTSVKQQVFLPGMKSLAAGTVLNASADKVGGKTDYKVSNGPIDF